MRLVWPTLASRPVRRQCFGAVPASNCWPPVVAPREDGPSGPGCDVSVVEVAALGHTAPTCLSQHFVSNFAAGRRPMPCCAVWQVRAGGCAIDRRPKGGSQALAVAMGRMSKHGRPDVSVAKIAPASRWQTTTGSSTTTHEPRRARDLSAAAPSRAAGRLATGIHHGARAPAFLADPVAQRTPHARHTCDLPRVPRACAPRRTPVPALPNTAYPAVTDPTAAAQAKAGALTT